MPKCEIAMFEQTGRGVRAREHIRKGEVVVEVPEALVLYPDAATDIAPLLRSAGLCNASGAYQRHAWMNGVTPFCASGDAVGEVAGLVICLMYEAHLGNHPSKWDGYLEFLPRDLHHLPLFWNAEDLKALTGTSVLEKMQSKGIHKNFHLQPPSKIENLYERYVLPFVGHRLKGSSLQKLSAQALFAAYKWALGIVSSYAFTLGVDRYQALVPVWDALNHITGASNIRLRHCPQKKVLQMIATQEIYCGEEVVNDFGKLSSSELLRRYGFVERERPVLYNRAEISLHDLIRVISFLKNDEGETWKAKIRWLKKRGWIPEDGWFRMDTQSHPPSHISSTIAVLWMTDATWQKSLSRSKYNRKRVPCPSRMKWKEIISCIARYKIEKLKHGEQLKPHGVENPQIRVADHIRKDEMHVWRSFLHTIESDRAETDPTRHR